MCVPFKVLVLLSPFLCLSLPRASVIHSSFLFLMRFSVCLGLCSFLSVSPSCFFCSLLVATLNIAHSPLELLSLPTSVDICPVLFFWSSVSITVSVLFSSFVSTALSLNLLSSFLSFSSPFLFYPFYSLSSSLPSFFFPSFFNSASVSPLVSAVSP